MTENATAATDDAGPAGDDSEVSNALETSSDVRPNRAERRSERRDDKTREQLREAQSALAERDAEIEQLRPFRERVESMHRTEAARLASAVLIDGHDLFREVELADLLDDGGDIDPVKVSEAAKDIAATHRHWAKQAAAPADQVTSDGKAAPAAPTFVDAFKPQER